MGNEDARLAKNALAFAQRITKGKKPNLLVLDEINLALHCQLVEIREALEFLDKIPKETDFVLTGRYAPKELLERADFANEGKDIKCPKEMVKTKGIQF